MGPITSTQIDTYLEGFDWPDLVVDDLQIRLLAENLLGIEQPVNEEVASHLGELVELHNGWRNDAYQVTRGELNGRTYLTMLINRSDELLGNPDGGNELSAYRATGELWDDLDPQENSLDD